MVHVGEQITTVYNFKIVYLRCKMRAFGQDFQGEKTGNKQYKKRNSTTVTMLMIVKMIMFNLIKKKVN